jgi:hypothetical protein
MAAPEVAVAIVTDTGPLKLPPLGVIAGIATVAALATLRVNAVVLATPSPAAVTVRGKLPAAVAALVAMVSTDEHVGLQEAAEKEPTAPDGSPETLNEIVLPLPELSVAVTVFAIAPPALTDLSPEFEREKLKLPDPLWTFANHALDSELGFILPLNALALTRVLPDRLKALLYFFDDGVGDWPSVV